MNKKLVFDNRLCYEREVARQHALHQHKLETVLPTCYSPSKVYLDSSSPAPQPHLATNAKRVQLEREKQRGIYEQNRRLASKMEHILHRQENVVLAASSLASVSTRSPTRRRQGTAGAQPKPPSVAGPNVVSVPTSGGTAKTTASTPVSRLTPSSSPFPRSPRKPMHSPAHVHMPGIRLDATQTPLVDCHLSPELAMGRGNACKKPTLVNRAVQRRQQDRITEENHRMKQRLAQLKPFYDTKKWDGEWQQHAHKFGHLRQDGTVGYLLPPPPKPTARTPTAATARGRCHTSRARASSKTVRGGSRAAHGLPSLEADAQESSTSRGGRLLQQQQRQTATADLHAVCGKDESSAGRSATGGDGEDEEEEMRVRVLPPCLLLEATTRQGVEIDVEELQLEFDRAPGTCPDVCQLGDRGLLVRGSWKDGAQGEMSVGLEMLMQVAQVLDDLEIMIKLETVSQVPKVGNVPRLSELLTDDELQKVLVGVVQHLRFQMAPTPPDASSPPVLEVSWGLPMPRTPCALEIEATKSPGDAIKSPQRSRPKTCPSILPRDSKHPLQGTKLYSENEDDDEDEDESDYLLPGHAGHAGHANVDAEAKTKEEDEADDSDVSPYQADWTLRLKTAAALNQRGRQWRTTVCKGSTLYLASSWFEEETGVLTMKVILASQTIVDGASHWVFKTVYSLEEMQALLLQLEEQTLTASALLTAKLTSVLP